jgi:hypothetical protein
MKELEEYRQKLLTRLTTAVDDFRSACLAVEDPYAELEPGGWNVHQVAVHTCDVDKLVYGARVRRTLSEDKPEFLNFDGDAYMVQHYDRNQPLPALLDGFVQSVGSLVAMLREMNAQGWSRESSHETLGSGLTLQTWVERGLDHIEEHLATVRKAAGTA